MTYLYQRTIHLQDTDAAGVVYFTNFLQICHEAYEHCLTTIGLDWRDLLRSQTVALPIVHASMDCFTPCFWGDRLEIELQPHLLKPNEFEIKYLIYRLNTAQIRENKTCAQAITRHVAINPQNRERIDLPTLIHDWIENPP
jgi:1,4-dihydroxy-2-naphthoyl-CoA hydrolase